MFPAMPWGSHSPRRHSVATAGVDLVVFRKPCPFQALYSLWKVLLGTHLDEPGVFHRQVKKLFVTADDRIPVQIDGDPGGYLLSEKEYPLGEHLRDNDPPDGLANHRDGPRPAPGPGLQDSSTGWTVEILPGAALELIAPADSHDAVQTELSLRSPTRPHDRSRTGRSCLEERRGEERG